MAILFFTSASADNHGGGNANSLFHSRCIGLSCPGDIKRRPVIDGDAQKRQPGRHGNGPMKVKGFTGDMALIVIQRNNGIITAFCGLCKNRIGSNRTDCVNALRSGCPNRRLHRPHLFAAKQTVFAAVRIKSGDRQLRTPASDEQFPIHAMYRGSVK